MGSKRTINYDFFYIKARYIVFFFLLFGSRITSGNIAGDFSDFTLYLIYNILYIILKYKINR